MKNTFGMEPDIQTFGQHISSEGRYMNNHPSNHLMDKSDTNFPAAAVRKSRLDNILSGSDIDEVLADKFGGKVTLGSQILA